MIIIIIICVLIYVAITAWGFWKCFDHFSHPDSGYFLLFEEMFLSHTKLWKMIYMGSFIFIIVSAYLTGYTPQSSSVTMSPLMLLSGSVLMLLIGLCGTRQLPYAVKNIKKNGLYPVFASILCLVLPLAVAIALIHSLLFTA